MTKEDLLKLATMSFSLMTPQEQVITLTIFATEIKKDKTPLDAFIDSVAKVCKSVNNG